MSEPRPLESRGDVNELVAAWLTEHADVLYRYALSRCRRPEVAEDLVQETFLAAIAAWASFRAESSVRTWLIGILRHRLIDHLRRQAREPAWLEEVRRDVDQPNEEFRRGYWATRPREWTDISAPEAEELRMLVQASLERMSEPMRLAFDLREIDGLSSQMVCEALGVTPTNLWTLVHRAKLRLRKDLSRHWLDQPDAGSE